MQRLRSIKPQIDMRKPPKPSHIMNNYKKEMKNMERLSEIQYQNRVLLRKMLHIDLNPSANVTGAGKRKMSAVRAAVRPMSAKSRKPQLDQAGLNAYNSLNRANRIRSLAKIIDENKILLDKLQKTKSTYNTGKWNEQF